MAKKPTVTTITTGYSSADTLNENFEALRDGFDNTLSLDGSTPNAMEADLDLNGNNIIGAAGLLVNGTDYLSDVEAAKVAAQAAQAAAELAETNAETAETNAESSETAAGLSATAAATSATASAASAVDATNNGAAQVALAAAQVTLAETAKTAAELAETNAETAESNAATSATNAATSATTASTGASTASTKASEAATSATNSATSATESETAKIAAEAAKDAALAALDSFDDRYLGAKASDPTLDNDGNALVAGALYYNTTVDIMKVYEGSVWVAAYASLSGALIATNNLSDVDNATTARTNLGLGTAATTASTDYATAAQGALADSAVQPNDSPTFGGLDVIGGTNTTIRAVIGGGDQALLVVNGDRDNDGDAGPEDSAILLATDGVYSSSVNSGFGNYGYRIGTINSGGVTGLKFTEAKAGVDIERMRINTDGNVGIATTNPSTALDVDGTVTATGVDVTGTITSNGLTVSNNAAGIADAIELENFSGESSYIKAKRGLTLSADYDNNSSPAQSNITFETDGSEVMRIEGGGNVGIGTTLPSSTLHVNSGETNNVATFESTDGNASIKFVDSNQTTNVVLGAKGNDFYVQAGGDEKLRILDSGNVGIGKTNPATPLDVDGTVTATSFAGDGSSLTGIAAGATGGGNDDIFYENGQNVTTNYTITNGKNAMSAGPITIDSGVTVTVGAGETWTVI